MDAGIFRKYDVRGAYPEKVNEKAFLEISTALGRFFKRGKIVVGHDIRLSSRGLYRAVLKGLSGGNPDLRIIAAGLTTTPMFYFLVNKFAATGGIMITASHNPKKANGMKVVKKGAVSIGGEEIKKIVSTNYSRSFK